ncbi:MAG: hypothetical protein C5S38_02310 [Candidatus Methanophagaceae archaeon]|nr:MAG: hypothetical protein C5S38_02310 [Methanophagales archaeon]
MCNKGKIVKKAIPAILAICILALTVSSVSAHPRTFKGNVYYADGTPCTVIDLVEITNTNTGMWWNQSTISQVKIIPGYSIYKLILDEPDDVNDGDMVMYSAASGTQTNTSYRTFVGGTGSTVHDIYLGSMAPTGIISVEPPSQNVSSGDTFTINITVNPQGKEIYSVKYDLFFNSSVVTATSQTTGTFLSLDGASTTVTQNEINSTLGKVTYNETRIDVDNGVTTPGTLASITFEAIEPGTSNLDMSDVVLSDPSGTSIETEINNGTVLVEAIIIPEPDLVVVEIPDQLLFANVSNKVTAVIKNNGSADAGSFNVSLYVNGTFIDKDVIAGLDAGNSTEVSFAWMPSETGNYILAVNADCDADIAESNETNNELSKVVPVVEASPDLTVTSIDAYHRVATPYESNYPCYNRSNEVDVTLKNEGFNVDGFNVTLYADDEFIDKKQITGLGAGEEESVRFYWTPIGLDCVRRVNDTVWISESGSGRDYNLKVIVDSDDDVSEMNETNNQLTKIETAHWNGYMADEPIENVGHGRLRGGLYYTTGKSSYLGPLHPGQSRSAITGIQSCNNILVNKRSIHVQRHIKAACIRASVVLDNCCDLIADICK